MAQAVQTLSRRSVLVGAAAVVPTVALSAAPAISAASTLSRPDWSECSVRLNDALEAYGKANELYIAAKKAMDKWDRRNPFPRRVYSSYTEQINDFDDLRLCKKTWQAGHERALRQSGVGAKSTNNEEAYEELANLCFDVSLLPAPTLFDMQEKARLAKLCEASDGPIRQALLDDLIKAKAPDLLARNGA